MLWFVTRWVGATILGFGASFVTLFVIVGVLTGDEGPEAVGIPFEVMFPVVLAAAVTAMAAIQWLLIRHRMPGSVSWIPASAGGILVAAGLIFGLMPEGDTQATSLLWGLAHALVAGSIIGSAQWYAIRHVEGARRWLPTSIGAWLAAELVGNTVGWYTDGGIGLIVIMAMWALLTGPAIYRLGATGTTGTAGTAGSGSADPAVVDVGVA